MKTIDLEKEKVDLEALIKMARREPVLLVTPDGKEFCIAEADDFEREVDALCEEVGLFSGSLTSVQRAQEEFRWRRLKRRLSGKSKSWEKLPSMTPVSVKTATVQWTSRRIRETL